MLGDITQVTVKRLRDTSHHARVALGGKHGTEMWGVHAGPAHKIPSPCYAASRLAAPNVFTHGLGCSLAAAQPRQSLE